MLGVAFASADGLRVESLLNRSQPYDARTALKVVLADPELDRHHPILNLLQAIGERSDAINHAATLVHDPGDAPPRHVLHLVGLGDESAPDVTQQALARAMYTDQVLNGNPSLDYLDVATPPVTGNLNVDGESITGVAALYQPAVGDDAQAVVFDLAEAQRQLDQFLGTAVEDGVPTVVSP